MSRQDRKKSNTTKLPLALQQELGLQDGRERNHQQRRRGGSKVEDRKEQRKAVRNERKGGGATRNLSQNSKQHRHTNNRDDSESEPEPKQRVKSGPATLSRSRKAAQEPTPPKPILKKPRAVLPSPEPSDTDESRASSPGLVLDPNSKAFRQRAQEDDSEIAVLERKLGLKSKSKSKLGDDMLDFVLEGLDSEGEGRKRKREGQDWLDQKRRKTVQKGKEDVQSLSDTSDLNQDGLDDSDSDDGTLEENFGLANFDDKSDNDGLGELEDDSIDDGFDGFESDTHEFISEPPVKKPRENPYIAPVTPGSAPAKYVPPSLRKKLEGDTDLDALKRQIQGQINKLSEANMISILGEIEKLYRTNPRQDVTTVLIDLVLGSFCIRSSLQNTFIILHAAFLAAVYKVMGTDFGAELLVKLVERFDKEYQHAEEGKEALNLISLLANLFTFNVVTGNIVYDHLRLLLSNFSETNAELLLRVVRDCGPQLRSDDPSALKSIVQIMQDTSAELVKKGQPTNVRTQVMMDTIIDLKNNKMKNATNAAGVTGEHITRMRKALGSLNNRALKATEPLRITREDLANSDKKGKWWLVGASWKGNEIKQDQKQEAMKASQSIEHGIAQLREDVDLLLLAKQYRMNTDIRRSIFVAIMSATDCRDAQTRLVKLRLSTKQEQEIAKVLLRCARAEPAYNPYYALLARNLCKENKKVRVGFQFALWDFFGRMGEKADEEDDDDDDDGEGTAVEMHEIVNIAKMYAYLVFHGHLTVGVLKTLNIGFLREQATMFLEIFLISIMTQPKADEEALVKVFGRAADTPQIVKGLQYFIKKNVRKSDLVLRKERDLIKESCLMVEQTLKMVSSVSTE